MNDIQAFLTSQGIQAPDCIFPAELLDPSIRKELNKPHPLKQTKETNYTLPGCYAWIGEGKDRLIEVKYIGKALKLKSRLMQHYTGHRSRFLNVWLRDEETFMPFIAVWFSEERASLESKLIKVLKPKYNRRNE